MCQLCDLAAALKSSAHEAIRHNSHKVAAWAACDALIEAEFERPAFMRKRGMITAMQAKQAVLQFEAMVEVRELDKWVVTSYGSPCLILAGGTYADAT